MARRSLHLPCARFLRSFPAILDHYSAESKLCEARLQRFDIMVSNLEHYCSLCAQIENALPVQVVGLDVGGDGGREQPGAGVSSGEATAEFGGGDVFVDGGQEMNAGALIGG